MSTSNRNRDKKRTLPSFSCDIEQQYRQGDETLRVLNGIELALWSGQSVALVAPSGAGKSTLLHIAGLLEHPDRGDVYIDGQPTSILADHQRTRIRRNEIGFVYQSHHLLPEFSALENVVLPQMIRGLARSEAKSRATELLDYLGLGAAQPSAVRAIRRRAAGWQLRAVANAPRITLADEPTGNLDLHTAEHVFHALSQLVKASGWPRSLPPTTWTSRPAWTAA